MCLISCALPNTIATAIGMIDLICVPAYIAYVVRTYYNNLEYTITVKPVYNDHSREQVIVVSVDRWSLYRGALVQLK